MAKLVVGINDLATLHPAIAAEADGWDPSTVVAGTHQKMSWRCKKGHTWDAVVKSRTSDTFLRHGSGCPDLQQVVLKQVKRHGFI